MNKSRNCAFYALIILSSIALMSCKKETKVNTELAEIAKPIEEIAKGLEDVKANPVLNDKDLLRNAVIKYQMQYFEKDDDDIIACGINMPYIVDGAPGEKKAYGYSSMGIYKVNDDGTTEEKAGSGPAPIAITYSTNGKKSNIDFICLTDSDLKSEKFNEVFPEDAKEWILKPNQEKYDKTNKDQEEQLDIKIKALSKTFIK